MNDFSILLNRLDMLTETKDSPWSGSHPGFTGITKQFRAAGMPSAPLDTISFIRSILHKLDIIDDDTEQTARKVNGFSAKKQALLQIIKDKSADIMAKSDEIQQMIEEDLPKYINRATNSRSPLTATGEVSPDRADKYKANAEALKQAKAMAAKTKQLGDATPDQGSKDALDVISTSIENAYDEQNVQSAMVKTTVAKVLQDIEDNMGEEGFDIEPEALDQVISYSDKLDSLTKLQSFIKQIASEPGYEKIAAYLSAAIKPLKAHETQHDPKPSAPVTPDAPIQESYTGMYLVEQTQRDAVTHKPETKTISTRDKLKPKTSWQAQSLRNMY